MDNETGVGEDPVLEPSFTTRLFQSGTDRLGYILFLGSLILWAEGRNLRSVNVILVIIAVFWLAVNLLAKTKLFTKNEKSLQRVSRVRKFKLLSLIHISEPTRP